MQLLIRTRASYAGTSLARLSLVRPSDGRAGRALQLWSLQTPTRTPRRCYASLNLSELDKKWQQKWRGLAANDSSNTDTDKTKYVLPMFPYPSGSLHLGHLRVYTIADVVARFHTLKGENVLMPMGWDSFGLPAENAALERGIAPGTWTKANISKMKSQLGMMNANWDWDREISTCDPEFYKHTQKLFLRLHEQGLAYQAEAEVNYDPIDRTVLANEQVDANGLSWRSGAKVEKRKLKQWFFRISEFRDALLDDLEVLARDGNWPDHVIAQQKNWLGKSTGALIKFPIMATGHDAGASIEVFTTRPDTLFGVQYVALAATHPMVMKLAARDPELQAFLDTLAGVPPDSKVGYLLRQIRAINPLAYHEETPEPTKASLPVYVAPYVLGDYGEGAVMGVPGHDVRDHSFWREHHQDQPVRLVLAADDDGSTAAFQNEPYVSHGFMNEHSGPFKGKSSAVAGQMIVRMLEAANVATSSEKWRLRDWLISRQRYWGCPIPIVHCDTCGAVPVPEEQLPVELPAVDGHWAQGKTGNPLDSSPDFVDTACPKCGGAARRDTDTMDTFVDSSWYYTRYTDPHNKEQLFSAEASKTLPVDIYIGGVEHAILHLLYARFIYKFLASTGMMPQYSGEGASVPEPFKRLITQGMVHGKTYIEPETGRFLKPDEVDMSEPSTPRVASNGTTATVAYEKMSKSKHNGVDPTDMILKHGADATRAHMLFQAPVADVLNWDEDKIAGVTRWLHRLHDQVSKLQDTPTADSTTTTPTVSPREYLDERSQSLPQMGEQALAVWDAEVAIWRDVQRTIGSVTSSYQDVYSLNTIVSDLMSLTNTIIANGAAASNMIKREALTAVVQMAAPIVPAFAEECWSMLEPSQGSMFRSSGRRCSFPQQDGSVSMAMLRPRLQACAVQVNGKVRGVVEMRPPPAELEGDESGLREWMIEQILATEEGEAKFGRGPYDLRRARRAIPVRGGKTINFVM